MTKQEQIDEIAKYVCNACEMGHGFDGCSYGGREHYKRCSITQKTAEKLYNAGYRKIPENAVVLTKEEYIDLSRNYVTEQIEQVRKETAEKILNELIDSSNKITFFDCRMALGLDKLAKQYGVEVEE